MWESVKEFASEFFRNRRSTYLRCGRQHCAQYHRNRIGADLL